MSAKQRHQRLDASRDRIRFELSDRSGELGNVRIPLNPISQSGVFDHLRRRPRSGRREGSV